MLATPVSPPSHLRCCADIFMSGSDDGTVREIDIRERNHPVNNEDTAANGHDNGNVIGALDNHCHLAHP